MLSAITFNLGRMAGYTCDYPEAERLLQESLVLEQSLDKPGPGNLTKRWSELARLYQDQRRDHDAVVMYERAVPELERMRVVDSDPVGYANYLDDYSRALRGAGREDLASSVSKRAAALRSASAARKADFVPLRFNDVCRERGKP